MKACAPNGLKSLVQPIGLTILLAVAFTTVFYVEKREIGTEINSQKAAPDTL